MALIHVPRPQSAINPERPVNSLLLTQVQHLHEAEKNLPLRYRSDRYINAIKTEGEAAAYIRNVTEAIHKAHADAAVERARRVARRGIAIAAAAGKQSSPKPAPAAKRKAKGSAKKKKGDGKNKRKQ